MSTYYKIREHIVLNNSKSQHYLWHVKEGWELDVSQNMLNFVKAFSIPTTYSAAYQSLIEMYQLDEKTFSLAFNTLMEKKIIEEYQPDKQRYVSGKGGMFHSDVVKMSECLKGEWCDLAFLGMPYDLNVTYKPGCRFAPSNLRKVSGSVFQMDSIRTQGLYDPVSGRRLLKDTKMVDLGDIQSIVFSRNGKEFDSLQESVRQLVSHQIFPVVIGGDHSISLPCIAGAAEALGKIGIIQLDAHTDVGLNPLDNWRESIHHGNFMDGVIENPSVVHIVQIGIRQLVETNMEHEKLYQFPGKSILENVYDQLQAICQADIPYYLTIDVDVMDPSFFSCTGTPLPGGFSFEEVTEVLSAIAKTVNLSGVDVVEFIPKEDRETEGVLVSRLLVNLLSEVMEKKHEYSTICSN